MDFPFSFFGARFWQPQNSKMAPNSDGSNCLIRMVITAVPSSWKAPRPHPIPLRAPMRQSDARCESVLAANNGRHLKPSNANATVCGAVSLAVSRITMPQSLCTLSTPSPPTDNPLVPCVAILGSVCMRGQPLSLHHSHPVTTATEQPQAHGC